VATVAFPSHQALGSWRFKGFYRVRRPIHLLKPETDFCNYRQIDRLQLSYPACVDRFKPPVLNTVLQPWIRGCWTSNKMPRIILRRSIPWACSATCVRQCPFFQLLRTPRGAPENSSSARIQVFQWNAPSTGRAKHEISPGKHSSHVAIRGQWSTEVVMSTIQDRETNYLHEISYIASSVRPVPESCCFEHEPGIKF